MKRYLFTIFLLSLLSLTASGQGSCPDSISISEPAVAVAIGNNQTFTANVTGYKDMSTIGYLWSVDKGKIVEGQGTHVITVSTKGIGDATVTATVEITGLPDTCRDNIAFGSGIPLDPPHSIFIDEFCTVDSEEFQNRLAVYRESLEADPHATGYIVNYGKPDDIKKRVKLILDMLVKKRKIDASRIVFIKGGEEKTIRTRLWIVPAGADPSDVF